MNKEKLDQIKNKIKYRTPEIVTAVSAVALVAYGIYVKKTWEPLKSDGADFDPLPVIEGEEKAKILGREDTILQKIEDDLYFLSVGFPKTED